MTYGFVEGLLVGVMVLPGIVSALYIAYDTGVVKGKQAAQDEGGEDE